MDDDPQLFNLNYCYSLETLLESEEEFKVVGNLVLPARHAVRQIKQASALNIVFIICNNTLFEIRISDFTIHNGNNYILKLYMQDEFLLSGMDGLFIFATGQGISKRPPIVLQSVIVKSFFYNPPYIHVLTKSGVVVISLNDMRVHQTLNMEEADSLVSLDGAIYGIKEMHLYSISPVAFEDQIAMKYFDDGNFNKAVEMLIESETDPKEVISQFSFVNSDLSSKYNSPQYYQFLEEFLLSIRDLPYTEVYRKVFYLSKKCTKGIFISTLTVTYKRYIIKFENLGSNNFFRNIFQVIDTTLLKLFTRNNKYEDLFKLSNLELDYKDCTKFLIDYGLLSYAAEIAWKGGDEDIALDIWTQIVSKNSGNTAFNVDIIAERIVRLSNPLLVARVLTWLVDIRPKQCLEASGFLKKLISHREEQLKTTKLKNSLLSRILTIDTVQIDESSRCEVCKMLITFEEPLSYLSTGFTVHSKCIKHPNLCPITNTVLF
uniref:Vps39_2 domain-containing protein n=1 Tax=Heterorhabditis bacteriophora TaxID=37862 RepID=A0A1I7X4V9_HETBA